MWSPGWILDWHNKDNAPAWLQAWAYGRDWLWPVAALLAFGARYLAPQKARARAIGLLIVGAAGFAYTLAQGFAIGPSGWSFEALAATLPALKTGQYGMGLGATLVLTAFAMLFALGLAGRGYFKGDGFVAGSVVGVMLVVAVFTFFPSSRS